MAKKTKKVSKAVKVKLIRALETIRAFSAEEASLTSVSLTDLYQVNNTSLDQVTFNLDFKNFGTAVLTDAMLHDINGSDKILLNKVTGSIINQLVDANNEVDGKFLNITSIVTATNQTPLPQDLKVDFSINGGITSKSYVIPSATFNNIGDSIIVNVSIFFFHI